MVICVQDLQSTNQVEVMQKMTLNLVPPKYETITAKITINSSVHWHLNRRLPFEWIKFTRNFSPLKQCMFRSFIVNWLHSGNIIAAHRICDWKTQTSLSLDHHKGWQGNWSEEGFRSSDPISLLKQPNWSINDLRLRSCNRGK